MRLPLFLSKDRGEIDAYKQMDAVLHQGRPTRSDWPGPQVDAVRNSATA